MKHKGKKAKSGPDLGRILVVEDDAVLALDLEAALLENGASDVAICSSLACTMTALEKARPDAIVLDIHLADRNDGWALAELVDQLGPRRPKIIFSTGAPDVIPPEIAGLGTILPKPYDPADLISLLSPARPVGLFSRLRASIG
ncbi:response regulator [Altericroceibacterium spongiae]|uniref:Response regulator n=1 Tax=Altericroceibacterium spongiae TaxID=2320269 RepID=A0A420EC52_9SPHN|nr:response regulator [Altericroceibacterium spongiae]RKF18270.1 response regulator [Altericroceibacterium spongiae]